MFLFKKNRMLIDDLKEYSSLTEQALVHFRDAIAYVVERGPDDQFEMMAEHTHKLESNADDVRRKIEAELYRESLLPDSREDLFSLLECLDKVPGKAESVLWQIHSQNMTMPPDYKDDLKALAEMSLDTYRTVLKALEDLFGGRRSIAEYWRVVDHNESVGDKLERKMVTRIFRSDLDKSDRILLKELVIEMGHIIDRCEEASDAIVTFNLKRQI